MYNEFLYIRFSEISQSLHGKKKKKKKNKKKNAQTTREAVTSLCKWSIYGIASRVVSGERGDLIGQNYSRCIEVTKRNGPAIIYISPTSCPL